jgi:hypothetical protein
VLRLREYEDELFILPSVVKTWCSVQHDANLMAYSALPSVARFFFSCVFHAIAICSSYLDGRRHAFFKTKIK